MRAYKRSIKGALATASLAAALALAGATAVVPGVALADEPGGTAVTSGDAAPAAFSREGSVWTVTDLASFKEAKADIEIERDNNGLTEATIVFTQDLEFDHDVEPDNASAVGHNYFSGIEGVTLTLTSEGAERVTLSNFGATLGYTREKNAGFNTNDHNARFFTGPLVLDNIELETNARDIYFAQGFPVTFTENFHSTTRISVAGGCMGTNRKLDGVGFDGGYVQFRKDPTACPASTHIEIYGGQFSAVYGGGYNSDVKGDTYVKIALNEPDEVDNNRYDVHQVFGGGTFTGKASEGSNATVAGNSTVGVVSGVVGDVYGGGSNSSSQSGAAVEGNTSVTVGAESGTTAYFSDVYGGGLNSTIGNYQSAQNGTGNTHVTINATAEGLLNGEEVVANIHGGGNADTVKGTCEVVLNGGSKVNWVFAGGTNGDYQGTATIENASKAEVAARIVVNGGTWDEIYSCVRTFVGTSNDTRNAQVFNGDVLVEFNGGKVNQFILSGPMSQITGDSRLVVNGGEFGSSTPSIKGYRYASWIGENKLEYGQVDGTRSVSFENEKPIVLWQIQAVDDIAVNNSAYALVRGSASYPALDQCSDLTIEVGVFGATGTSMLLGDLYVAEGGTLALNGTGTNVPESGSLNVAGSATGAGELTVVEPSCSKEGGWISSSMAEGDPTAGEVYVRSMTTDETAQNNTDANMLDLAEGEATKAGLYVEYTTDAAALSHGGTTYAHAWRIAQGVAPAETVTLTFEAQDMVAYTGGDSLDGNPFPTIRYKVTATDEDNGTSDIDLSEVVFSVNGEKHSLPEETKSGDIVPIEWMPETFTLSEESEMNQVEHGSATGDMVAGDYEVVPATIPSDDVEAEGRTAEVVCTGATLTVRDVSQPEDVVENKADVAQPVVSDAADVDTADGIGIAVIDDGTKFFTNGREELGLLGDAEDPANAQISLLFDELLPGDGTADTADYLRQRAVADNHELTADNSEFRYLDLVNENDGNAWVSTENDAKIDIYWPVPDGVDPEAVEFSVLHFQGLHREYREDLAEQIERCEIEVIDARVEGDNVVFTLVGNQSAGCFSPFALTWSENGDEGPEGPTGGDQKPAGDKNDQGDKNDDIPDTGDESFSAVPVLVAGCAAVVVAAGVLVWVRKRQ